MNNALSSSGMELGPNAWIVGLIYMGLVLLGCGATVFLLARTLTQPPPWKEDEFILKQKACPNTFLLQWLTLLASLLVIFLSARQVVGALWGSAVLDNEAFWILAQSVEFHWLGLILLTGLLHKHGGTWGGVFGLRGNFFRSVGLGLLFYLASMPFIWFYALLYQLTLRQMGYKTSWQDVALALTGAQSLWMRIYFFFMGGVLAPLFEETFFRGILLPYFAKKWGPSAAIFAVSAIFAGIHFHVPSLVPLFIFSVALSLAYLRSRSIVVPVIMHGLFNAINMGLMVALR